MRPIFLSLFFVLAVSFTRPVSACDDRQLSHFVTPEGRLSCDEKHAADLWLEDAPREIGARRNGASVDRFLRSNPEAAARILRTYVNFDHPDGLSHEKWGILEALPPAVRSAAAVRAFELYQSGVREPFTSFEDCWGRLLLASLDLARIVRELPQLPGLKTYNDELLKLAIASNYGMLRKTEGLEGKLDRLYTKEYRDEKDFYEPEYEREQRKRFLARLGSGRKLSAADVPAIYIP